MSRTSFQLLGPVLGSAALEALVTASPYPALSLQSSPPPQLTEARGPEPLSASPRPREASLPRLPGTGRGRNPCCHLPALQATTPRPPAWAASRCCSAGRRPHSAPGTRGRRRTARCRSSKGAALGSGCSERVGDNPAEWGAPALGSPRPPPPAARAQGPQGTGSGRGQAGRTGPAGSPCARWAPLAAACVHPATQHRPVLPAPKPGPHRASLLPSFHRSPQAGARAEVAPLLPPDLPCPLVPGPGPASVHTGSPRGPSPLRGAGTRTAPPALPSAHSPPAERKPHSVERPLAFPLLPISPRTPEFSPAHPAPLRPPGARVTAGLRFPGAARPCHMQSPPLPREHRPSSYRTPDPSPQTLSFLRPSCPEERAHPPSLHPEPAPLTPGGNRVRPRQECSKGCIFPRFRARERQGFAQRRKSGALRGALLRHGAARWRAGHGTRPGSLEDTLGMLREPSD